MQFFSGKKYKNIIKITLATLGAMLIFMNGILNVHAAEFKHNHSNSCYSTASKPCSATHQMSTRTGATTRHCFNCNAQVSHTTYVYWDKCNGTGQSFEQGGYHVCKTCGATSYSWGSQSRHGHNVSTTVLSCGKSNAATGKLWIRNTLSDWTTEGVVLEAGVDIVNNGMTLAGLPYSWDNAASWTSEATNNVTENGIYSVYAKSADGTVVSETVTVNNIDRTGPVLTDTQKSISEWTNQNVTITFTAGDLQPDGSVGCGLAQLPYSYDDGVTYTVENSLTVSENGVYQVLLSDNLGNVGNAEVEITNIDKEMPRISGVIPISEGWQTESVVMQVMAEDLENGSGLHELPYSVDGENWQLEPEFILVANGVNSVYVRDKAGNISTDEFEVNQLDNTAPVIESIQVIPDKIWKDKVEVTIKAADFQPDGTEGSGLHEEAYSIDGGLTWQTDNTFVMEAGQEYDVRVRDALEWTSDEYMVTREQFPYPAPPINNKTESGGNTQTPTEPEGMKPEEVPEEVREEILQEILQNEPAGENKASGKANGEKRMYELIPQGMENVPPLADALEESQPEISTAEGFEVEENLGDNTLSVQVITMPWHQTVAGKTVIVGTSAILIGNILGLLSYLLIFSARIYCIEDMNRERKLGRVFIHRIKVGYTVYLSDSVLKAASVPRYRIRISEAMLKKARNARLLVESDEKNLELLIQESIDFEL